MYNVVSRKVSLDPDCLALNPSSSVYHEFQSDYCSVTILPPVKKKKNGGLKQVCIITLEYVDEMHGSGHLG